MVQVTEQRPDSEAPRKRRLGEGSEKVWRAEPTGADPEKPGAALCDYLALLHWPPANLYPSIKLLTLCFPSWYGGGNFPGPYQRLTPSPVLCLLSRPNPLFPWRIPSFDSTGSIPSMLIQICFSSSHTKTKQQEKEKYIPKYIPYIYLQLQSLLCCPPQQNLFNKLPLFTVSNSSSPTPAWPSAHNVTDTTLAKVSNSLDGVRFNEPLGVLPLSDPSAAFAGRPLSF